MLQYIYAETGVAAQEIAQEVAPEVNSVTKEQIKDAAKERAEEIAGDIAKAESTITQDQHAALVDAITQVIYTQVCSDLAILQSCQNVESIFTEEIIDDYYASLDDDYQDIYGQTWDRIRHPYRTNREKNDGYTIAKYERYKREGTPIPKNLELAYKGATYRAKSVHEAKALGKKVTRNTIKRNLIGQGVSVAGGAGLGAAIGAVVKGKEGAKIGALLGGAAGNLASIGYSKRNWKRTSETKGKILRKQGKI